MLFAALEASRSITKEVTLQTVDKTSAAGAGRDVGMRKTVTSTTTGKRAELKSTLGNLRNEGHAVDSGHLGASVGKRGNARVTQSAQQAINHVGATSVERQQIVAQAASSVTGTVHTEREQANGSGGNKSETIELVELLTSLRQSGNASLGGCLGGWRGLVGGALGARSMCGRSGGAWLRSSLG